jgi:hypothetical protein
MSTRTRALPGSGAARMRRALALAGCGVLSVGLCACESTEQESARIGRESAAASRAAAPKTTAKAHARGRSHGRSLHPVHSTPGKAPASP